MNRIIVVFIVLFILTSYITLRIIERLPLAAEHVGLSWLLTLLYTMCQVAGPTGDEFDLFQKMQARKSTALIGLVINWASYLAIGIFSCMFMFTLVADVTGLIWQLIFPPADVAAFNLHVLMAITGLTAATIVAGVAQVMAGPRIKKVTVAIKNLPASFEGFKIVQISDLHVGPTIGRRYAQNAVDMANSLSPDVVALTGDFIDGSVAQLSPDLEPLKSLKAPFGMYYIPGNHEYYWGIDEWVAQFKRMGAHVLMNAHDVLKLGNDAIILAGVTDYSTLRMKNAERMDAAKAIAGAPQGLVKILLAHQPASYAQAAPLGYDLQLSGHTHGGQYFPFSLLIGLFQKYYKGLNRHGDLQIYVNLGTGYWGPPLRAGVPAEITLLTLTAAP